MLPLGMAYASKTNVRISVAATTANTAASTHSRNKDFLYVLTAASPINFSFGEKPRYGKYTNGRNTAAAWLGSVVLPKFITKMIVIQMVMNCPAIGISCNQNQE